MNNIIEIGGKDYPFHFGMRTLYNYAQKHGLEFHEIDMEKYDSILSIFVAANEAAVERSGKGNQLDEQQLEDKIDENPQKFIELMTVFNNSKFRKAMGENSGEIEEKAEEVKSEKKKKD